MEKQQKTLGSDFYCKQRQWYFLGETTKERKRKVARVSGRHRWFGCTYKKTAMVDR
jgi:hypothetical protein